MVDDFGAVRAKVGDLCGPAELTDGWLDFGVADSPAALALPSTVDGFGFAHTESVHARTLLSDFCR